MATLNEIAQSPLFGNVTNQPVPATNVKLQSYLTRLNELDMEIADIENKLATIPADTEIEINKYRAGAEAIRSYDPITAAKYDEIANQIANNQQTFGLKQDIAGLQAISDKKKLAFDETKQLAVQYRNARMAKSRDVYNNLSAAEKKNVELELSGIKNRLMQDPFGKYLVGAIDENPNANIEDVQETDLPVNVSANVPLDMKKLRSDFTARINSSNDKPGEILDIEGEIDDLAKVYGDNEVTSLRSHAARLKLKVEDEYRKAEEKRKEGKTDYKDLKSRAIKQKPIYIALQTINKNPNSISNRSNALNLVLRKESGAAIGSQEYANKLQSWLSPEDFESYIDDLGGWKGYLAIRAGAGDQMALSKLAEYLGKVDVNKIRSSLDSYLEGDVIEFYSKKSSSGNKKPTKKIDMSGY